MNILTDKKPILFLLNNDMLNRYEDKWSLVIPMILNYAASYSGADSFIPYKVVSRYQTTTFEQIDESGNKYYNRVTTERLRYPVDRQSYSLKFNAPSKTKTDLGIFLRISRQTAAKYWNDYEELRRNGITIKYNSESHTFLNYNQLYYVYTFVNRNCEISKQNKYYNIIFYFLFNCGRFIKRGGFAAIYKTLTQELHSSEEFLTQTIKLLCDYGILKRNCVGNNLNHTASKYASGDHMKTLFKNATPMTAQDMEKYFISVEVKYDNE